MDEHAVWPLRSPVTDRLRAGRECPPRDACRSAACVRTHGNRGVTPTPLNTRRKILTAIFAAPVLLLCAPPPAATAADVPAAAGGGSQAVPAAECIVPPATSGPVGRIALAGAGKPRQRDRSCFISTAALRERMAAGNTTLVDVRPLGKFERYRIAGSIHIPLSHIRTKSFLRAGATVLIDEGHTSAELEAACAVLKQDGFKVSILDGGLRSWHSAGGAVVGDLQAARELNLLSPADLYAERRYSDWVILDSSGGRHADLSQWLPPRVVAVPPGASARTVSAIRETVDRERRRDPHVKIVVATAGAADHERLAPRLAKAGVRDVLYLPEGLAGYRVFLDRHAAMLDHKDQPLKLPACRG